MTTAQLLSLSLRPGIIALRRWWLTRAMRSTSRQIDQVTEEIDNANRAMNYLQWEQVRIRAELNEIGGQ